MTMTNLPTIAMLHKLLVCDAESGTLYWRDRHSDLFKKAHDCNAWNARYAGKRALCTIGSNGYFRGTIFCRDHSTHRVIWAMIHGQWPEGQIDHINHNITDNRIDNLRVVSGQENRRNGPMPTNNTSGHVGVTWHNKANKWQAQIGVKGVSKYLGCYLNIQDAVKARDAASVKYGFHINHGVKP